MCKRYSCHINFSFVKSRTKYIGIAIKYDIQAYSNKINYIGLVIKYNILYRPSNNI